MCIRNSFEIFHLLQVVRVVAEGTLLVCIDVGPYVEAESFSVVLPSC